MLFKRLRIRLTVVCSAVTSVILIGMACSSLYLSERQLAQRGQAAFTSDLNSVLYHLRGQTVLDLSWLVQTESSSGLLLYIEDNGIPLAYNSTLADPERTELIRLAGRQAYEQLGFDIGREPTNGLLLEQQQFAFISPEGQRYYAAAAIVPMGRGWLGVILLKSMRPEEQQVLNLRWSFLSLTLFAILLLWLFAWLFTRYAIRPVQESQKRQIEFISAASHELRSPLAVIQASSSALPGAPPERAARFCSTISSECSRMARLIDDMLTLANAEQGKWPMQFSSYEVETLLLNVFEQYEQPARNRRIHLQLPFSDVSLPHCWCDPDRIEQVLSIFTDNALSYVQEGGCIRLQAVACKNGVRLSVSDNGPGIPEEHKKQIFERFYRADPARSKKEHYGLGLCIAQEIIALHHSQITLEDTPGGGATFSFVLPLAR